MPQALFQIARYHCRLLSNLLIILKYEVALILNSKILHNKLYYLVDWLGYDPNDRMWEPYENLANASNLFKEFHHQYPNIFHAGNLANPSNLVKEFHHQYCKESRDGFCAAE